MSNPKKYAVIVAGGKGERMQSAVPKQFLPLLEKPVLYYSVKAFVDAFEDIEIILVLPAEWISYCNQVLSQFPDRLNLTIVQGGATRFHSVKNGLAETTPGSVIFVHDAVRPLLSAALIHCCYEAALKTGSAVPAIDAVDSFRKVDESGNAALDRTALRVIQTPQTFTYETLIPAFEQPYDALFTDEASVVERAGQTITLVPGEEWNLKITRPIDLAIAEAILKFNP